MRKVHRYGYVRSPRDRWRRGPRTGLRSKTHAACGVPLYPSTPDVGRGIPDEAFANLPTFAQCQTCLYREPRAKSIVPRGYRVSLMPDEDVVWEGGVSSMETMFLALARLATDMLELRRDPEWRHRCYHRAWQSGKHSLIEPCGGCGSVSLLDVVAWNVGARGWHPEFDSRDVVRHEDADTASDGQRTTFGNWCRKCLRVVGEFHKINCRQPRLTAAELKLAKACQHRPDSNYAAFVAGVRCAGEIQESEISS